MAGYKRALSKALLFVLLAALCALSFMPQAMAAPVVISDPALTVSFPEGFIVLTRDNLNQNKQYLEHIGHTTESFKRVVMGDVAGTGGNAGSTGPLKIYAASADNANQFHLNAYGNDFSRLVDDIDSLTEAQRAEMENGLKASFGDGLLFFGRAEINGVPFYRLGARGETADKKPYCAVQYVTLVNEKYYVLTYYNSADSLSEADTAMADNAAATLNINRKTGGATDTAVSIMQSVVIIAGIVVLAIVGGYIIVSIVSDVRERTRQTEREKLVIKRRTRR